MRQISGSEEGGALIRNRGPSFSILVPRAVSRRPCEGDADLSIEGGTDISVCARSLTVNNDGQTENVCRNRSQARTSPRFVTTPEWTGEEVRPTGVACVRFAASRQAGAEPASLWPPTCRDVVAKCFGMDFDHSQEGFSHQLVAVRVGMHVVARRKDVFGSVSGRPIRQVADDEAGSFGKRKNTDERRPSRPSQKWEGRRKRERRHAAGIRPRSSHRSTPAAPLRHVEVAPESRREPSVS